MTSIDTSQDRTTLTVITTHVNADFDALASLLAAQKLYSGALVIFPASGEKNLRNFFIQSMVYLFNMADIKDVDLDQVGRLVLVDTRQPGRIGNLEPLLDRDDIEIHVYDHHPRLKNDVRADAEVHRLTGATVTILTEILKDKNIPISADEATIMCLGIYEDTGSFTFSSTTEADLLAAAYLLSKGANLDIISQIISREISPQQVGLLNDMIQAMTVYNINGVDVCLTLITTESFVPDFSFLVHKMVKMENISAIFAIARMDNKIYVVARSRVAEVDVGGILTEIGGGGHPYAAAATIKGKTLTQVEHQLLSLMDARIKSRRRAQDLMSAPAITVSEGVTCKQAGQLLTRYNINALLVVSEQTTRLLGYISRQVIEKAMYHDLGDVPVKEYMTSELFTVKPDADLPEIQEKIITHKQRILPVMLDAAIIGVITRTDLLNVLILQTQDDASQAPIAERDLPNVKTRNIKKFMRERLPARILDILRTVGRAARACGFNAFVVGGFVRDLFLFRANEDIDIVIEGDGIAFARQFAKDNQARIHCHAKFGTAVVIFPDGFKLDVASARLEYYRSPAALPTVEMSSIKLDLYRRDFTINTLAIHLNPDDFGTLIDFFGAQRDIKEKAIRVLHNLSFVEDPTRVFRAIRFEQRFDFSIGKLTASLIDNAVKMNFFKGLSGRRVFAELRLILEEENPTPAIQRMGDFGLLKVIDASLRLDNDLISLFNNVKKVISWHDLLFLEESYMRWAVYFMALIRHCDPETTHDICQRFELPPHSRDIICKERFATDECLYRLQSRPEMQNSNLYERLAGFKIESVLYMMAVTRHKSVKRDISHYIMHLRHVAPVIKGKDLKAMGLVPGPAYRELLETVRRRKLDGELKTREDELAFAKRYVQKNK